MQIVKIQKQLYSPKYEENPIALWLRKICDTLLLFQWNKEEIIQSISSVLENKNIPYITKQLFIKFLKENNFNTENPLTAVEIENELTIKYPGYNWFTFQATIWEWKKAYSNMFSTQA